MFNDFFSNFVILLVLDESLDAINEYLFLLSFKLLLFEFELDKQLRF